MPTGILPYENGDKQELPEVVRHMTGGFSTLFIARSVARRDY